MERRPSSDVLTPGFCQIDGQHSVTERCDGAERSVAPECVQGVVMLPATPIGFIADDAVSVRSALESLIESAGWVAETFASAQEFLRRPRVAAPSCLVLDVGPPGLDGLERRRRVATDRTDMPIIFISGYGDVPMTVRAMKAGAVEFLMKPFKDDVLLDAIRGAIDRSLTALREESESLAQRSRSPSLIPVNRFSGAASPTRPLNKQ